MGLSVHFRTQRGVITNRRFEKNEGISVYGKSTTLTGIINPGTHIRINVTDRNGSSYFFDEKFTDLWGDYDFWFRTPGEDKNLNVQLIASYPVSGQDITNIPIMIGNAASVPLPKPEEEKTWLDWLPILGVALVGLMIYKELKD